MNIDGDKLTASLQLHEGLSLHVYDDETGSRIVPGYKVVGHPSIGFGRALDVNGISIVEANYLLQIDIGTVIENIQHSIPWIVTLDDVRARVLIEMAFNMGIDNLLEFHDTLRTVQSGQYTVAAASMLDSIWARQVGQRAVTLADMMKTGQDPVYPV